MMNKAARQNFGKETALFLYEFLISPSPFPSPRTHTHTYIYILSLFLLSFNTCFILHKAPFYLINNIILGVFYKICIEIIDYIHSII